MTALCELSTHELDQVSGGCIRKPLEGLGAAIGGKLGKEALGPKLGDALGVAAGQAIGVQAVDDVLQGIDHLFGNHLLFGQ